MAHHQRGHKGRDEGSGPTFDHPWHPGADRWARSTGRGPGRASGSGGSSRGRGRGRPFPRPGGPEDWDWGSGPFFGRGARAARGDIRTAILQLLAEEPMHGYQIMREIRERSGGVWKPSPGSIYPTLQQLEDEDLIASDRAGGKKVFHLTDTGRAAVAALPERDAQPWQDVQGGIDPAAVDLRRSVGQVATAAMQVVQVGTSEQIQQAQRVLADVRRQLYRLLAEDEPPTVDTE